MSMLDQQSKYYIAFSVVDNNLSEEEKNELNELIKNELVVRCDTIPHHRMMLNPSYTYVSNDDVGRKLALEIPLYTAVLR